MEEEYPSVFPANALSLCWLVFFVCLFSVVVVCLFSALQEAKCVLVCIKKIGWPASRGRQLSPTTQLL